MLSVATDISLEEAPDLVEGFGGICYPAHIDREANGMIAVLGTFPDFPRFFCAEFHDGEKISSYLENYSLEGKRLIISSDAHFLWDIKERSDFLLMEEIPVDCENVGERLINYLRNGV